MASATPLGKSFRQSIARIAQYRPFAADGAQVEYARRLFVLAAAHENSGLHSLAEARDVCQTLWGLELDVDELREEIKTLERLGQVARSGNGYRLTDEASREIVARIEQSRETERSALADWERAVADLAPGLSGEQVDHLREDLLVWLQYLISRYGIEAARLLYPDEHAGDGLAAEIEELSLDFLPERDGEEARVRPKALYAFIREPTRAQRNYLGNLMTTGYLMAVFTLDPAAQEAVQEVTRGQVVYLDTNVVYGLLNLSGPTAFLSISRIVELTREAGYKVCVTQWTVDEMKRSVKGAREKLAKTALPPRALADIAAEAAGDSTFITAYWRKFKETGVSPKDFLDLHEQIDGLLEKHGVEVATEGVIQVNRNDAGLEENISLLETVPGGVEKSRAIQEHDVKHRLLIEQRRGDGNRRFSNAGYWFLTKDSVLIPFAAAGRKAGDPPPFAVSLGAWAHIVRSLCPRTDDYEQTLADLLATLSVRPRGVVGTRAIAEILGRIDLLTDDSTREIATRMMLDDALLEEIDSQEDTNREHFIDAAVKDKKTHLQDQLAEMRDEMAKQQAAREAAEQERLEAAAALEREQAARQAAEQEADDRRAAAENEAARADEVERRAASAESARTADHMQYSRQVEQLQATVQKHARWARRTGAVLLGGLAGAALLTPLVAGWVSGGWPLVGLIVGSMGILFLALTIEVGMSRAWKIAGVVLVVVGAVAAVQQMVSAAEDSPNTSSSKGK